MVCQFGPGPDAQTTVPAHLAERYRTPTEEESGRLREHTLIHRQLLSSAALVLGRPERLAQCHRCGLALASIASHNLTMTPELSDDDKAILAELLREVIERDRFPLSPRVRSYKAILAKLAPPQPEPLPPPKPPGERSMALTRRRRR